MTKDEIMEILTAKPGATGGELHYELSRRTRLARWFGYDSLINALFGASFGRMYILLAELEAHNAIVSIEGVATAQRGWRRPLHYFVKKVAHEQIPHL